jgi:hypothetical protein
MMRLSLDHNQPFIGPNSLCHLTPDELQDWAIADGLIRYDEDIKKFIVKRS